MVKNMDAIIVDYMNENYHPDMTDLLIEGVDLIKCFDSSWDESELLNVLFSLDNREPENTMDPDAVQQAIPIIIERDIAEIISAHGITLNETTTFSERNKLLAALYSVQTIADVGFLIRELEVPGQAKDRYVAAMSHVCEIKEERLYVVIEEVEEISVKLLHSYLTKREGIIDYVTSEYESGCKIVRQNIEDLLNVMDDDDSALGVVLYRHNVMPLRSFELYLKHCSECFAKQLANNSYGQLALDIYSLLSMSAEGHVNPLEAYRTLGHLVIPDNNTLHTVERSIIKLISLIDGFKQAHRISK